MRLGENPRLAGLKHCNRLEQVLARAELANDPLLAEACCSAAQAISFQGP